MLLLHTEMLDLKTQKTMYHFMMFNALLWSSQIEVFLYFYVHVCCLFALIKPGVFIMRTGLGYPILQASLYQPECTVNYNFYSRIYEEETDKDNSNN